MPLPKISTPSYELELPSTGEIITYRPFLVREEKLLVLAMESENQKDISRAIKEVLKSWKQCISEYGIRNFKSKRQKNEKERRRRRRQRHER